MGEPGRIWIRPVFVQDQPFFRWEAGELSFLRTLSTPYATASQTDHVRLRFPTFAMIYIARGNIICQVEVEINPIKVRSTPLPTILIHSLGLAKHRHLPTNLRQQIFAG